MAKKIKKAVAKKAVKTVKKVAKKIAPKKAAKPSKKVAPKKTAKPKKKALVKKATKKVTVAKVVKAIKKVATKKVAVKKAAPKKTAVKKVVAKKIVVKKAATKKVAAKKAPAKKNPIAKTIKKTVEKVDERVQIVAPKKTIEKPSPKETTNDREIVEKKSTFKPSYTNDPNLKLAYSVIESMQERKAKNIIMIDLTSIGARVCDYFIICDAESTTHVNSIADSVEGFLKKNLDIRPYHSEGFQNSEWILIDYVTVVAHIFRQDIREFYNIESLWADAKITYID